MKEIRFSPHALEKLALIQLQGFAVNEAIVVEAIRGPQESFPGYLRRFIVQTVLDGEHVLRVVYEEGEEITVITLYPGRRERYET